MPQVFSLLPFEVREPSVIVQYFLIDFFELFHSLGSVHCLLLDLLVEGAPDLALLVESVLLLLTAQLLLHQLIVTDDLAPLVLRDVVDGQVLDGFLTLLDELREYLRRGNRNIGSLLVLTDRFTDLLHSSAAGSAILLCGLIHAVRVLVNVRLSRVGSVRFV